MKFTFTEWKTIQHALTVARNSYERHMNESKPSDEHTSSFQIFQRQMVEVDGLLKKIESAEI